MWRSFQRSTAGNMAVLAAFGFAICAGATAIGIDFAAVYEEKRDVQRIVDLATLDAALAPADARARALAAISEQGLAGGTVSVEAGHYDPNPALSPEKRFRANAEPLNAAQVKIERPARLYVADGWVEPPSIKAQATAATKPLVSFSIGSRLVTFEGGIANAVLGQLLGTQLSLTALDYTALASAQVDVLSVLDGLRQRMGVQAGTYNEILAVRPSYGDLARTVAGLVNGNAKTATQRLAGAASAVTVPLDHLLSLGEMGRLEVGSGGQTALTRVTALDLLTAAATLGSGQHQLSLSLAAGVPNLTALTLDIAIGEPPQGSGWFAVGPSGTVVRTAQARIRIVATLKGGLVLLNGLVRLPLYLELAPSEATVSSATCPPSGKSTGSAVLDVLPGSARLTLGDVSASALPDFGRAPTVTSAKLLDLTLLRIRAAANADIAASAAASVPFSVAEIEARTRKTVRASGQGTTLTRSLLSSMSVTVEVLGLGLSTPAAITAALGVLLQPLGPVLDLTLDQVLGTLGLGIGSADVAVHGVRCPFAVLVG